MKRLTRDSFLTEDLTKAEWRRQAKCTLDPESGEGHICCTV